MNMVDSTGTTDVPPPLVDPGSQPEEPFFEFEPETGDLGASNEEWGFNAAPAPVTLVAVEEDWDFDSAPVAANEAPRFKDVVTAEAEKWLGREWRANLDTPASEEPAMAVPELSWREEVVPVKWEDTETFQKYHNTLKGMLGGHRAALLASVAKRNNEERREEDDQPAPNLTRQKRRDRNHVIPTDEDQTHPFT